MRGRDLALALGLACAGGGARAEAPKGDPQLGRELFAREWLPADPRSHGGDGLGPVYNDSSCVACHNLGGPGGAGPTSKNADIISAFPNRFAANHVRREPGFLEKAVSQLVGLDEPRAAAATPAKPRPPRADELVKLHAGFRTARSLVLHRFSTDASYDAWRVQMTGMGQFMQGGAGGVNQPEVEQQQIKNLMQFANQGFRGQAVQAGEFSVSRSQRNPTPLFGAGLIDSVPDEVLEAAAKATFADFPEVKGRVARQKDGRIGRFGWKGQTPRLDDFVRTACAVELGLESPRHHQGGLPTKPDAKATGLDLTDDECAAIVAYLADLPAPVERAPEGPKEAEVLASGKAIFASAGCAACHTPKLGAVRGIYSDLLLHDLGQDLGDVGQYESFDPSSTAPEVVDPAEVADAGGANAIAVGNVVVAAEPPAGPGQPQPKPPTFGASRFEWRTPPLWGLRDSGPYLHDGRAETIEQAVALHGGQAAASARKYFGLKYEDRQTLQTFLKSLAAPTRTDLARAGD